MLQRGHFLLAFSLFVFASSAQAQLTGATLDAEWIFPSFGTVLESHSVVVGPNVELPAATIINDSKYEIDIGDDWVEFRFNSAANWSATAFNGWLFRDSVNGLPPISGYSVDSFSAGVGNLSNIVTGFNDDEFWANFAGVTFAGNGDWIRLRLTGAAALTAFCFGDGTGSSCPCGNFGATGEGCSNSTTLGGLLTATGTTFVTSDDLVLHGSQLPPGVPSLFFSGPSSFPQALIFGDGLRCASGQVTRLEIVFVNINGDASSSVGIASSLGANVGTHSFMQLWYRDPGGPCSGLFNVTNALDVTWQ